MYMGESYAWGVVVNAYLGRGWLEIKEISKGIFICYRRPTGCWGQAKIAFALSKV